MNKFLKLPLFLGTVVGACGLLLAVVYKSTEKKIASNELAKSNQAYVELFSAYNASASDFEVVDTPNFEGCTKKVVNKTVNGACYNMSISGRNNTIKFVVAFADNKYVGYSDIANGEDSGYGKDLIESMGDLVSGLSAQTKLLEYSTYTSAMAGKSATGEPLAKAIELCRADYMAMTW